MGEDSAELNRHVSVSKDQNANADNNPLYFAQQAAQHQAILDALEDIDINVDSMDINLADVETLITATNVAVASLEAANDASGDDIVTAVDSAKTTLDATLQTLQASNETHSDEEQAAIASLESAVAAFNTAFDNRDLATETTQSAFKSEAHADSLDTQAAVDELKAVEQAEHDETQGLIGEVSPTPTVNTVQDRLKNIYEAVDGLELSLDNIDIDMDDVEGLLATIDAVLDDTLLSIGDETDAEATGDGSAIAILKRIRTRLDQLITDFNAEDFASETTLAAFKAENATNLNDIEADIEAFKTAFDNRDLATETTLAAFKAQYEAEQIPLGDYDEDNSRTTAFGSGEDWFGDWVPYGEWPGMLLFALSDEDFDIEVQWSPDGVSQATDIFQVTPITTEPPGPSPVGSFYTATFDFNTPVDKYYRVHITGGATGASASIARMWRLRAPYNGNFGSLSSNPDGFSLALLTKAVQAGTTFDGTFKNAQLPEHGVDFENTPDTALTNGSIETFTVDTGSDLILDTAHGLTDGDAVVLTTTDTLPDPLSATDADGDEVVYWVINANADDFQLVTTYDGTTPVDITDAGTGTHSYQKRGEYVGTFEDYGQIGHLLPFSLGASKPALQRIEWSEDGTDQVTGTLVASSAIDTIEFDGGVLGTLWVAASPTTTMVRQYGRVRIVNGPTDWTPGFDEFTMFVGKGEYTGSFDGLTSNLTALSTALLTRSVLAGRLPDGSFDNVALSSGRSIFTKLEGIRTTPNHSIYAEGFINHVRHDFGIDSETGADTTLDLGSTGSPTFTDDAVDGGAVAEAAPGEVLKRRSVHIIPYASDPGQGMGWEMTWLTEPDSAAFTGSTFFEFGVGDDSNGFGQGRDATGLYVFLKKNGSYLYKDYQADWNGDKCDGGQFSLFKRDGEPEAIDPDMNNVYFGAGKFLYAAAQVFGIESPTNDPIETHVHQFPNAHQFTSIATADLPLYFVLSVDGGAGGPVKMRTGSWHGGVYTNKSVTTGRTPDGDYRDTRATGRHADNSTSTPLNGDTGGSDHIFRGEWFPWQDGYAAILADITADVPGTLYLDLSQKTNPTNGTDDDIATSIGPFPYDPGIDPLLASSHPTQSKWARLRYINGTTAQSEFQLDATFTTQPVKSSTKPAHLTTTRDLITDISDSITSSRTEESVDGSEVYTQDKATLNSETGKRGKNVHLTGIDEHLHIGGIENVQPATSFVVSAEESTEIYSNDGTGPQAVKVANSGAFHAFVNPNAAATENDDPHFLGGSSFWLLNPGETLEAICEDTGGASNIVELESAGNTAGGTATSPDNAKVSNDSRAIRDAVGETLTMEGFSHTLTAGYAYDRVRIHHEARKSLTPASETVTFEQAGWGEVANAASVTTQDDDLNATGSMDGGTDQLYVAFVTRNALNVVSAVDGPGGETFQAIEQNVQGGGRRIDAWYYYGDIDPGAVTASMSTSTAAQIAVHRVSNANSSTPIEGNGPNTGTGVTASGPTLAKTDLGIGLLGVSHEAASATPGSGYTERSDESIGSGSNTVSLATESKPFTTSGSEAASMTLLSSTTWLAIGITILPANTVNPVETLSFEYDGTPGTITAERTWANTSDADQYFDITGDLDIETFDPSLLKVISTLDTLGSANFESDVLEIEVRESTGANTRIVVISGDVVVEGA